MYHIELNNEENEIGAYKKLSMEYIKILRGFRNFFPRDYELDIKVEENKYLSIDNLKNLNLYNEYMEIWKNHGSELILILKLVELGLEEEATNIAWEILKISENMENQKELYTEKCYYFGLDILYVVARAYPHWARFFTIYIRKNWSPLNMLYYKELLISLVNNSGWSKGMMEAYLEGAGRAIRKIMCSCGEGLGNYLKNSENMKLFMGLIAYKVGIPYQLDNEETLDKIMAYYEDAGMKPERKEVALVFLGIGREEEKEYKVEVVNTYTDSKFLYFQAKAECSGEMNVFVKISHPHINKDEVEYNLYNEFVSNLSRRTTVTDFNLVLKDNELSTFYIPYTAKGDYQLEIFYKNKSILQKSVYLANGKEERIEVLELGSIENNEFIPFDKSTKDFGIRFRLYNGKCIGKIEHPHMRFVNVVTGAYLDKESSKIIYNNAGEYTIKFSPKAPLDFVQGDFNFLFWNEGKSRKLYEYKFSFLEKEKESAIDKFKDLFRKKEEEKQAFVESYGIFGFAKEYVKGKNIALTVPNLIRKASIGSYIGCMYTLSDELFKEGENSINIVTEVEVRDYDGKVVLETRWPDMAFAKRKNTCAFLVEEGELFEGHWTFKVKFNKSILFSQSIPVIVEA